MPGTHKAFDTHPSEHRRSGGCVLDHGKWAQILITNPGIALELPALYPHGYPTDISTYTSVFINHIFN